MDKKKIKERKKTNKKSIKLRKETDTTSIYNETQIFNFIEDLQGKGLEKISLSPLIQKIIGCRIGENITAENPWVFVNKEKIEDNMFFHENSSEFLPIKSKIENYPESEILLGCYSIIQDKEVDFLVCVSTDVKLDILEVIEEDRKLALNRILKALNPPAKPWKNLGSEIEVNGNRNLNNRALLEIELISEYFTSHCNIHLSMCWAGNLTNKYEEVLPGRFPYQVIMRKCVDASTQCTLPSRDQANQSNATIQTNKYTQYSYDYDKVELTKQAVERIYKIIADNSELLCNTLTLNFNINLFSDDYTELVMNSKLVSLKDPIELRSYQDVINCKHKKISSVSWNAFVSGMVAVAYTITPIFYIGKFEPIHNDAHDCVHEKHLILLWSYMDNVRPKLYIHAFREVTAISFCPYDENILVGGYCNGQIVVWDITDKIAAVETREVLTHLEIQHRQILAQQTTWIKKALGVENVFPVLTSPLELSHKSAVTAIKWIPPSHYISKMGKYEKTQPKEEHMQFMTVSLGGSTVNIWDLKQHKHNTNILKTPKKKSNRLAKIPEQLTKNESPLKAMQKIFSPQYIFYVKDPVNSINSPLTNIVIKNQMYGYVARNAKTIRNIEEQTYFDIHDLLHPFDDTQKFILSSSLGRLQIATWEGTQYNQGLKINSEACKVEYLVNVHDGPIIVCDVNPFLQDILLTVGGSIFAIWNCTQLNVPLMWRKSKVRYISGMWSFRHPLTLYVTKSDSRYEVWNMIENSESPIRIFKYKGNKVITLFSDMTRLHARKETLITTDVVGAFKVFYLPLGILNFKNINVDESKEYIDHIIAIKKYTEQIKINLKKRLEETHIEPEVQMQDVHQAEAAKLKDRAKPIEVTKEAAVKKWQKKQENSMYRILLEQKRLDIKEIKRNRIPMQMFMDQEKSKQRKIESKLLTREEDISKMKDSLMVQPSTEKIRRKITVSYPKEMAEIMKQKYVQNYKDIENSTIQKIKSKNFIYHLDWKNILQYGFTINQPEV